MKKFMLCLALPMALSAAGAHLSPDEALARIEAAHGGSRAVGPLSLVYTGGSDYYVFAPTDGAPGFSIVSADDCALPLLGYSDTGRFDPDNMAPAMKAWLGFYAAEISEASSLGISGGAAEADSRAPIAPMVTALWSQDYPYNLQCPKIGGVSTMTGCVATAMAEVFRYHRWPEKGTGSFSYSTKNGTYSLDFSTLTFDWDNMTDTYSSKSTSQQRTAVATLMKACGYSTAMDYGTESSGAQSGMIAYGAINHLGYSKGTIHLLREYYSPSRWNAMVYDELAAGRPVLYDGVTQEMEGHQFVIDGYSSDGFFHLNWGWGGLSDGYYRLSALAPDAQGIGGSVGAFSLYQGMIAGLRPDDGTIAAPSPYFITSGAFTCTAPSATRKETVTFIKNNDIYNDSYTTMLKAQPGVKLTAADGSTQFVASSTPVSEWEKKAFGLEPGADYYYPIRGIDVAAESFPTSGTYTVSPAARNLETNEIYDILVPFGKQQTLTVECSDTGIKFTDNPYTGTVKVTDITLHSKLYNDRYFSLSAKVTVENDEFTGKIRAALYRPGGTIACFGHYIDVEMMPGMSQEIEYTSVFKSAGTTDRELELAFIDGSRNIVSEKIPVTLYATPADPVFTVDDFHPLRPVKEGTVPTLSRDDITFGGTLNVSQGYFCDELTLVLIHTRSGMILTQWSTPRLFASEGDKVDFTVGGSYPAGVSGSSYIVALYNGSTKISGTNKNIKLSDLAGIEDVEADSDAPVVTLTDGGRTLAVTAGTPLRLLEIHSLTGRRVMSRTAAGCSITADLTGLPAGCYLVHAVSDSGKSVTVKIVK